MSKEVDELFALIKKNSIGDRDQLEKVRDELMNLATSGDMLAEEPLARMTVAGEITRITDSLTKVNAQLLELARTRIKKDLLEGGDIKEKKSTNMDEIWNTMEKNSPMS